MLVVSVYAEASAWSNDIIIPVINMAAGIENLNVFRIHEHVVDRQRYAGDRVQAEAVRELPGTPAPDAAVDREPGEDIVGR